MGKQVVGQAETIFLSSDEAVRKINFNASWKFYLGTSNVAQNISFDDSDWWNAVTLPHDFSIFQSFTTTGEAESGFLPGGTGWYRKGFKLSKKFEGKTLVLNFDGVYNEAYIYINGIYVGEHHYGYTPFAFDITNYVICDGKKENVIAIKVVNTIPSSRWYSGSGIYRNVTLIVTDPVHVARYGTYVTTPNIESGDGTVAIEVDVANDNENEEEIVVQNTIFTTDGQCVSETAETTVVVDAWSKEIAKDTIVVDNPKLWSIDEPNLYMLSTKLFVNGVEKDSYETYFGFRYYSFDPDTGFSLNGKNVKLNGVCLHHDQGALGSAAYYDAMYRQLSIMKDMGTNAIRTSHNPVDEKFIEICNKIGLLVIEEAFDGWSIPKNGNTFDFSRFFLNHIQDTNTLIRDKNSMTWAEFVLKSMIKRDRNAPSIILWSLGNEIQEGASAAREFPIIAQNLIDWVKEVDYTRPTTIGDNTKSPDTNSVLGKVLDVFKKNGGIIGFNYANNNQFTNLNTIYGSILASETASAVNSRGIYMSQANSSNADGRFHLTSYDTSTVGWGKTAHESIWDTVTADYVAGEFVWTGFDYIGEPTPWNGTGVGSVSGGGPIPNSSYFGIVDTTGFEKDVYYLYRSQWNKKSTTLHLVTAWDGNNMISVNGKTPVIVYSNASKVELYRNDTLVGLATRITSKTAAGHEYYTYTAVSKNRKLCFSKVGSDSERLYATFYIEYEPGTIWAKGYDESGNEITEYRGNASVSTPGIASKLKLEVDKTEIDADRHSLVYVSVSITDEAGNLDTTANHNIYFNVSGYGKILGVDNGDQATVEKYQQRTVVTGRKTACIAAYAGKALLIVRSTREVGDLTVEASSLGLTSDRVTIKTNPVEEALAIKYGIFSYTMVRDYTMQAGTVPVLETTATGIAVADGVETQVSGEIVWEEISPSVYATPKDHIVEGVLTFEGYEPIAVICRLHIIADVVALQNISTVTTPGTIPSLPDKVEGVLKDGTLTGEFEVEWQSVNEYMFAKLGDIVTVNGMVTIIEGVELPVTATVRIAKASNKKSANVADAAFISQDIPSTRQTGSLVSIINGSTTAEDGQRRHWSNKRNRTVSDNATITFTWATAQLVSHMNLYYHYDECAMAPKTVTFEYSLNGVEFVPIEATGALMGSYSNGAKYRYTFESVINPIAIRMTLVQQNGTSGISCVALNEVQVMTYAGMLEYNGSSALSAIEVDGTELATFSENRLIYHITGSTITAKSSMNAGITILPEYENVVRILTVSEDQKEHRMYVITK